jgi:putative hydrolase
MSDEPFDLPPELLRRVPLLAEMAKVLSWTGGPVNWDLARQVAVAVAAGEEPVHEVAPGEAEEAAEAVRVAELWLADAPGLAPPARVALVRATAPSGWAERVATLREVMDPIASKVVASIGEQAARLAPEGETAALAPALRQVAPVLLGVQVGALGGALALDLLGTHDLALPVAEEGRIDLVTPTIRRVAADYHLDPRETLHWVALQQVAVRWIYEGLPGPAATFYALLHAAVAALEVDLEGAFERLQGLDLSSPERLREAIEQDGGVFGLGDSPAARRALDRLSRFVALVEATAGLAAALAGARLPQAARIREALARRRAEPGRGVRMLGRLIGVEVPPERLRAAASFCRAVHEQAGGALLARALEDVERLPDDAELAHPARWLARVRG